VDLAKDPGARVLFIAVETWRTSVCRRDVFAVSVSILLVVVRIFSKIHYGEDCRLGEGHVDVVDLAKDPGALMIS
jgi:hypothetical protein